MTRGVYMRLSAFMGVALAAFAAAGSASAIDSWANGQANGHVLICTRASTNKPVTIKGKAYYSGALVKMPKGQADKLIKDKKAAKLNENDWRGKAACLIDDGGVAIPVPTPNAGGSPPPPPPVVTPPPPPPVVTPPPPPPADNSGKGSDNSGNPGGGDSPADDNSGKGNDDPTPPPPPPPE